MMLNTPLELEVFWLTPAHMSFESIGIDCEDPLELRRINLYSIDHIVEYTELVNNKPATRIISGGCDYLVNLDYESLQEIISLHL